MRTPALLPAPYIVCPTIGSQTGYHYQTPTVLGFQSATLCSSTQSVRSCGLWSALLAQPLSTLWNILWQPRGISFAAMIEEKSPECCSPKYEMAMGYRSTSTPLEASCASQHVVGIACTVVHTPCSLPSWLASNILHEWPLMREIGRRCGYRISLHEALP